MGYKNKTVAEYSKEYRKKSKYKKSAWMTKVYGRMKRDNKNKFGLESLPFTKLEFINWVGNFDNFDILFDNWIKSDFLKDLVPSVDRIDDYKSYTFDNMQIITWIENNEKGRNSIKNKIHMSTMTKAKFSKEVIQIKDGITIKIYPSVREASRDLCIDHGSIARCCRGELKSYKGFNWRYSNENN